MCTRRKPHLILLLSLLWSPTLVAQSTAEKPDAASRIEPGATASGTMKRAFLEFADGSVEVVTYREIDGKAVLDGDILIHVDDDGRARIAKEFDRLWSETRYMSKAAGINGSCFRWHNNTVPFTINVGRNDQEAAIRLALDHIEGSTAVRFVERTNEADYVDFVNTNDNICRSYVGRQGGRQEIELHAFGCGFGQVVHEVGHALGLWHEHQRSDRDNSVLVNWANIEVEARSNFEIRPGFLRCPFDFGSVMNYGSTFFAINPNVPTLTRLDGSTWAANRNGLSGCDATGIGDMYRRVRASIEVECTDAIMRCDLIARSQYGVQPVATWRWTIEDGSVVSHPTTGSVTFFFNNPGRHYIGLEITDSQGDRATASTFVDLDPNSGCRICR